MLLVILSDGRIKSFEIMSMSCILKISTPPSTNQDNSNKKLTRVCSVGWHEVSDTDPKFLFDDLIPQG